VAEIAGTATAAAGQTGDSPATVRYLAVTPIPSNELGYCLFEAPPFEAIQQAHELARVPCEPIVEAFHATAQGAPAKSRPAPAPTPGQHQQAAPELAASVPRS
jgi:hypothetical protein